MNINFKDDTLNNSQKEMMKEFMNRPDIKNKYKKILVLSTISFCLCLVRNLWVLGAITLFVSSEVNSSLACRNGAIACLILCIISTIAFKIIRNNSKQNIESVKKEIESFQLTNF